MSHSSSTLPWKQVLPNTWGGQGPGKEYGCRHGMDKKLCLRYKVSISSPTTLVPTPAHLPPQATRPIERAHSATGDRLQCNAQSACTRPPAVLGIHGRMFRILRGRDDIPPCLLQPGTSFGFYVGETFEGLPLEVHSCKLTGQW